MLSWTLSTTSHHVLRMSNKSQLLVGGESGKQHPHRLHPLPCNPLNTIFLTNRSFCTVYSLLGPARAFPTHAETSAQQPIQDDFCPQLRIGNPCRWHRQVQTRALGCPKLTCPGVIKLDPWLEPFSDALRSRYSHAQKWMKTIDETEGGLDKFSKGADIFGFVVHDNGDITYREWAPNALRAYLIGDFSKETFSSLPIGPSLIGICDKMNGTETLRQ